MRSWRPRRQISSHGPANTGALAKEITEFRTFAFRNLDMNNSFWAKLCETEMVFPKFQGFSRSTWAHNVCLESGKNFFFQGEIMTWKFCSTFGPLIRNVHFLRIRRLECMPQRWCLRFCWTILYSVYNNNNNKNNNNNIYSYNHNHTTI